MGLSTHSYPRIVQSKQLDLLIYIDHFNNFDASLVFAPNNIQASRLEALVDTYNWNINDEHPECRLEEPNSLASNANFWAVFAAFIR
jgi:polyisoprenoid-binding protein YceI